MSTVEHCLRIKQPFPGDCISHRERVASWIWIEDVHTTVRVCRTYPESEVLWEGEAYELARMFGEQQAEIKRLHEGIRTFCRDLSFEIREFQFGRPTAFKTLLVQAQRLCQTAEAAGEEN